MKIDIEVLKQAIKNAKEKDKGGKTRWSRLRK